MVYHLGDFWWSIVALMMVLLALTTVAVLSLRRSKRHVLGSTSRGFTTFLVLAIFWLSQSASYAVSTGALVRPWPLQPIIPLGYCLRIHLHHHDVLHGCSDGCHVCHSLLTIQVHCRSKLLAPLIAAGLPLLC